MDKIRGNKIGGLNADYWVKLILICLFKKIDKIGKYLKQDTKQSLPNTRRKILSKIQ
jgi:hypothetical protein